MTLSAKCVAVANAFLFPYGQKIKHACPFGALDQPATT